MTHADTAEMYRGGIDPNRAAKKASWFGKHSAENAALRSAVHAVLTDSANYLGARRWSVQGFGMLRCYLGEDKRFRLNVWDDTLAVPGVSTIHDHPWSFDSWIINGRFHNVRFVEDHFNGDPFEYMVIKTGEGGGPSGSTNTMRLRALQFETYSTGDKYHQEPTEIHESLPLRGTITLNDRTRVGDGEHARVFWPHGEAWVDAEPREATPQEVKEVLGNALDLWL